MRVFVTGASGFIGKAVTKELLYSGHTVLGLARSDRAVEELITLGADVQRGSLSDLDVLKKGAATCDGVIHLAFIHDFTNYSKSCQMDRDAIQAMADSLVGTSRPLIITSGTMLLPHGRIGTEADGYDTFSPTFSERGLSESLAKSLASTGIRTTIMRVAPVNHGDGDNHMFMSTLVLTAREKGASVYINDGLNRWPAVHVQDTAVAYRLALERSSIPHGLTFHIVAEEGVKMKDIAEVIGRKLGVPVKSKSLEAAKEHFGLFGGFVGVDNPVSYKKTREVLGWEPKQCTLLADLEDGNYFRI